MNDISTAADGALRADQDVTNTQEAAKATALSKMSPTEACAHMVEMLLAYRAYCKQHDLCSIVDRIEKTVLEIVEKQYGTQPQKQYEILSQMTKDGALAK